MSFLKQLFCGHIWSVEKKKSLYTLRKTIILVAVYEVSALYQKCLKCGKTRIVEQKVFTGYEYR